MARRSTTEWVTGDDRFIELMHALTQPEEQWMQPERPDILSSLDELIAWTNDSRQYDERMHKSGWDSAVRDFLDAAGSLGADLGLVLKRHIDEVRGACQPDVGGDQALRARLASEAATLRRQLAVSATLLAAWADLRRVCSRRDSTMKAVASRRDTFWAVVRATDRNTVELSRQLSNVLCGDPLTAFEARLELGEADSGDGDFQSILGAPLTSPADRHDLVLRLLSVEPTSRAHVVWFAFRRASLNGSINQQLKSIQFFDARWLRGNLFEDGPYRDQIPSELSDIDDEDAIPGQQDVVLARVDLGVGTFSNAIRVANERLDALLGMSTLGYPVPWEQMSGFIHAWDGRVVSHRYFVYEEEGIESPYPMHDTAAQISHMAPRVAPLIPVQDRDLKDIVEALHWWRAGLDQPTAASIILNVRIIELVASRVGETSWTTYLEKYIKNRWIRALIVDVLALAFHEALHRRVTPDVRARQREIFLEATTHLHGQQQFHIGKAARHLDELIAFTPSNLPLARDLRTIERRTSGSMAIGAWCTELDRSWGGWAHRLERVRNSIAHGGPFTEQAVLLTQPFSQRIAVWVLGQAIEGFLEGKTLDQSHSDARDRWEGWLASVKDATSIEDIL